MDDLMKISDDARRKRRNRILAVVLIAYFAALFIYAINIPMRQPPFFTQALGYDEYPAGSRMAMRFFAIGGKDMTPLPNLEVKLELVKPASGASWTLYQSRSGAETGLEAYFEIPASVRPDEYLARLTTRVENMGFEFNEYSFSVTPKPTARMVDIHKLDEKLTEPMPPLKIGGFKPPVELRFLCNNGRFVQSLRNDILAVAENPENGMPVEGLAITMSRGGKVIANQITDGMGYAHLPYYPHDLGAEQVLVEVTDPKGKDTFKRQIALRPPGSQVVLQAPKVLHKAGEPLRFKLEALRQGPWFVDLIHRGNWLDTERTTVQGSAPSLVQLSLPQELRGPVFVQVASDTSNPGTSFDAFYVYIYDPKDAELDMEDPRFKNADPEDPKWDDIRLEKPLKKLWGYVGGNPNFPQTAVERWQRKLNAMSVNQHSYKPLALAEQILREVPKDYLLLPELINTKEKRLADFKKQQSEERDNVIWLLALSGLVVIMMIVMRIYRELQVRQQEQEKLNEERSEDEEEGEDHGITVGGKHLTLLVVLLGIIAAGYGMMLYLLATIDWHLGL